MKKIIVVLFAILLCSCSSYKMQKLPDPVRDNFTENINIYIYRPKGCTDEELKEAYGVEKNVNISVDDFRVLYISTDREKNPQLNGAVVYVINCENHFKRQENQEVPYNPWTKELSEILGEDVVSLNNGASDFSFCEECRLNPSIEFVGEEVYYFGNASEKEIENCFRSLPINIRLSDEKGIHYASHYIRTTYLINDVNIYMENDEGTLVKLK